VREVIFYLLIIGAGTGGELCISRAMKAVGEVKDFRPAALIGVFARALRVSWMWVGVTLIELCWRRFGWEILSWRTGHAQAMGGRSLGVCWRGFGDHGPTVK
jgi:hypothetical protein